MALDGSRFKAVNYRDKTFTASKVAERIEQVEASIARYLTALDRADLPHRPKDADLEQPKPRPLLER